MYMVRKRFMYWHIPPTCRITLKRERGEVYCFYPVKRVKRQQNVIKYILRVFHDPIAKTIRDREVELSC
ncbi:hypothetical protein [Endozoicomonas sp. 4G]|uniref:hypothetical protein n=1 Tax=Endozoicomonas sp. 4G TaxID=2872754 RepID=UPI0020786ECD|nr:hypothetical protein [Endozoicomonas sp. 4G]